MRARTLPRRGHVWLQLWCLFQQARGRRLSGLNCPFCSFAYLQVSSMWPAAILPENGQRMHELPMDAGLCMLLLTWVCA